MDIVSQQGFIYTIKALSHCALARGEGREIFEGWQSTMTDADCSR